MPKMRAATTAPRKKGISRMTYEMACGMAYGMAAGSTKSRLRSNGGAGSLIWRVGFKLRLISVWSYIPCGRQITAEVR